MRKLSKEEINKFLEQNLTGIQMTGEYVNSRTKTSFTCECGNTWLASPDTVKNRTGCPRCSDTTLSKEEINSRLEIDNSPYRIHGEYVNAYTKTTFECPKGHCWENSWRKIKEGRGCPICRKESRKVFEKNLNEKLLRESRGIRMMDEYVNCNTKNLFLCENGHEWPAHANSILAGRGCPVCAKTGFNPDKPAWTYILEFDGFIKYGITNNLKNRLDSHRKNGEYKVAWARDYDHGYDAVEWENNIKRVYGGKYVTKEECPDGYTETLPLNLLESLIKENSK